MPDPSGLSKTESKRRLTTEMISAGVRAFSTWDADREEVEALVVSIFLTMVDEAAKKAPAG